VGDTTGLPKFAEAHRLADSASPSLPAQGDLLSRGGQVKGAVTGSLPGGEQGTLAHYTYSYTTTDSDHHTETHHRFFTIVVTAVPESIGFMPALGFAGSESEMSGFGAAPGESVQVDLGGDKGLDGAHCYRYKGASENFTRQLLSPALVDWLARSESDLGFELADGVLCTSRKGYLEDGAALEALCAEAAHLTAAIRSESEEEEGTGGAAAAAAKDPNASDPRVEAALREVAIDPPADVNAAEATFRRHVSRSPRAIWRSLGYAVVIAAVLNVPGAAIPILLAVAGSWIALAAIEALLVAITFFFVFRKEVRQTAQGSAGEAFFRGYARSRGMKLEEPLHFAATHAEARLAWKPDRVLTGPLPGGGEGSLCIHGDGSKRADRIAVVAGPAGPVAESELEAEPKGLSAKDLDTYLEQLAGEDALRSASPETAVPRATTAPQ
jgi:hypothetical protein